MHRNGGHNYPWRDNDPKNNKYPILLSPEKWLNGDAQTVQMRDSNAIKWLNQHQRNPHPKHLIWDVETRAKSRGERSEIHYWLESSTENKRIEVIVKENTYTIKEAQTDFIIHIDPQVVDLNKKIIVRYQDQIIFSDSVLPDVRMIARSYQIVIPDLGP